MKKLRAVICTGLIAAALCAAGVAGAAITFRAASSASLADGDITVVSGGFTERTTCGSITPAIPAGAVGDLLIAQVMAREDSATVTMPGWTTLYTDNVAGEEYQVFLFWRTATNTDPNTITQAGTCDHLMARITRFGNVDTAQPFDFNAGSVVYSDAGDVDTGTQAVNVANSLLVLATFVADNRTVAQDATFTQLYDDSDPSSNDGGMSLNYRVDTTTGTKGPFLNMDLSGGGSDPNHGLLFVVRPRGLTINVPTGTVANDVMVASITVRACSSSSGEACTLTVTAPAGWTLRDTVNQTTGAGTDGYGNRLLVYYRVATAAEPASYTWTFGGTPIHAGAAGSILSFAGVNTVSPVVTSAGQTTAASYTHAAPSIDTGTVANTMLVSTHSVNSSGTWAVPGGMTEAADVASLPTPNGLGLALETNYELRATAGVTGTRTATLSNPPANDTGATHMLALRPSIDHFSLNIGSSSASTCSAKNITITAQDASNATVTDYTGTITISTSSNHGNWTVATGAGTLDNGTADDGAASYVFAAGDSGVVTLALSNTHADDLTISVVDSTLPSTLSTSATINFRDNVFVFTNDTIQVAGRNQAMSVAMWRRDTITGNCFVDTGYTGAKNLDAWITRDAADPSGAAPTIGALTLPNTAPAVNPASNNLALTFSNGAATFNLSTTDVGKYVLSMRDDTRSYATAVDISDDSSPITTRPFALVVNGVKSGSTNNPNGANATDSIFIASGVNFEATIGAYRYNAAADSNNDGVPDATATLAQTTGGGLAPSFDATATLTRSAAGYTPAAGTAGTLSNTTFTGFSGGQRTRTDLSYSEVGSFVFDSSTALVTNYLGTSGANLLGTFFTSGGSQTNATRVGRFTPDHFALVSSALLNRSNLVCGASTFTYLGEPFRLTLQLEAQNAANGRTGNYLSSGVAANNFAKLDVTDGTRFGVLTGNTTLNGRLSVSASGANAWQTGVNAGLTNILAIDVTMARDPAGPDGAFDGTEAGIVPNDTDSITLAASALNRDWVGPAGNDHRLVDTTNLRYGRLYLQNAFGSELLALPMAMRAQYYVDANTGFVTNSADACTSLTTANLDLANNIQDPALGTATITTNSGPPAKTTTASIASSPFSSGDAGLSFSAPNQGGDGYVDVTVNLGGFSWLRYDWDGNGTHDNDPAARATFGIYKGSPRHIYLRERY